MRPTAFGTRRIATLALVLIVAVAALLALTAPRQNAPQPCLPDRGSIPSGVGVNVRFQGLAAGEIAQQLSHIRADGFDFIRLPFSWAAVEPGPGQFVWDDLDLIAREARQVGLRIIAVLEDAPAWAKANKDRDLAGASPRRPADFQAFAEAVAARYRGQVAAYQIWDEPNLGAHWGSDGVDPAAYTALLSAGYRGVKLGDAAAVVLAGGLAPTTEESPQNLDDLKFLEGMYAAGASPYFDALALKPYGFWSDPDESADLSKTNFARAALHYEVMCKHGDGAKGIWAVEFGWNALPPDWQGRPSPWGTDSAERQQARSLQAVRLARAEWPWMGPMAWAIYRPQAPLDDPIWGFALVRPDGQELPFAEALGALASLAYAGPGDYPAAEDAATWIGDWRFSPLGADIGQSGDTVEITFHGTRIDLHLRPGDYWAHLFAAVDGAPANALPRDSQGRAYIVLYDPEKRQSTVTAARGLQDGEHVLRLQAEGGWGQWALAGWTVYREQEGGLGFSLVAALALGLLALAASAWWWASAATRLLDGLNRLPTLFYLGANAIGAAAFLYPGPRWLPFVGLAIWGLSAVARLDVALGVIAASLPFYLAYGQLLGQQASITPALLATAILASVARGYLAWTAESRAEYEAHGALHLGQHLGPKARAWWEGLQSPDFAVAALVAVSALSLTVSTRLAVSLREWVQVIVAAAAFYVLVRSQKSRDSIWLLVDGLTAGATAVSLLALVQLVTGSNLITAEGVYRVRGLYGSPNNLALFLGRSLSVALCLAAFGQRRRLLYGAAAALQFAALFATFSRGGILLGVPALLLFIGLVRRGRVLWAALAGIVATVAALIPLAGSERIASLFRTGEGTAFLRLNLWRAAWNMIRDHPLRGVGLDNFLYLYRTRYILPAAWEERNLSHPHNFILDWWTRLGILGPLVFAWLVASFGVVAWRAYRQIGDSTLRALLLGLAGSAVYMLAHGLVDASFFLTDLALAFALTLGVAVVLHRDGGA